MLLLVLTACSSNVNQEVEDDIVKIWWYQEEGDTLYNYIMEDAIDKIISCAKLKNIKIDIKKYSYTELSYGDYILKRNVAVSHGDVNIIFDTSGNLYNLKDKAGSYDKIKNYENLFDNLKNQYCIPLCVDMSVDFVNNDVLKRYNIQPKNVITLDEYYEIKQKMKELGAEFKLNTVEFEQLIDYYCRKNNVEVVMEEGKLNIDKNAVLTAIHELVEDVKSNYDYDYYINVVVDSFEDYSEYKITERKSGYDFSGLKYNYSALNYINFSKNLPSIENYSIVIWDNNRNNRYRYNNYVIPCVFIPKNNKNDDTYTIVDTLLSDGFQTLIYDSGNTGIITNSEKAKELIGFDKNWNYVGIRNLTDVNGNKIALKTYPRKEEEKLYELLTKGYEIIRNRDMSDFFTDRLYYETLNEFVWGMTIDAIKDNKTFDQFNELANDFITNLNVRNN